MIEKLLDDFYHVEQACSLLSSRIFDRPLPNLLHCVGGEAVMTSRWMGLIIMTASMFVFIRFLHSGEKRKPFHLFVLFHPIILFPYLYASQLSSAVTVAWGIGGVIIFFHKFQNMAFSIMWAFLLACMGLGVRFEAPYILIMLTGSVLILLQSRDNLTIVETIRKYFHRENVIKSVIFFGSFVALKKWAIFYFAGSPRALQIITTGQGRSYPIVSWYNSQVVAILHYLQNFFFPFSHSFYGNWQEYFWIERTFHSSLLAIILATLTVGMLIWSYRSQQLSSNLRLLMRGLVMFILIAFLVSLVPRTEWYYPSRGHLAAVVLMGYVSVFVSRLKREKVIGFMLAIYLIVSMGYAVLFQYKNLGNMYAHDRFFYGDVHPFLRMELAAQEWNKGNQEVALQTWFNIYKRIPADMARKIDRAYLYKLLALYRGWWAYEVSGRHEESSKLLPELLNNGYPISTLVCLQDSRVEIDQCLNKKKRIINFCNYYFAPNAAPFFEQAHPFRIDMKYHCRKLGIVPY